MTFYDVDVGQTLTFDITKDGAPASLAGATVDLLVDGVGTFACTLSGSSAEHIVAAGEFPAGTYAAVIRVVIGALILHSQAFGITVKALYE